jgi:prefoldin alpha subunit
MNMAGLDETKSRMSYEVAVYKEQLNLLKKEMERISLSTLDISNATKAVEDLKAEHILVPVGGGSYIKADVHETQVLVPIGGNYVVEMSKASALLEMHKRIDATKQAVTKLNEEFVKINKKLMDVGTKLKDVEKQVAISERVEEGIKEDYI